MTKVEAKFVEGKVKTLPFSALVTAGRERVRMCEGKISCINLIKYLVLLVICCTRSYSAATR